MLKDEGVVYEGKTFKPVKVRFMGLIDPVARGGYQMIGTNSTVVPSNVATVYIAYAGLTSDLNSIIFPATHPTAENGKVTSASDEIFDYLHQAIGFAEDVQAAIEAAAVAAGVPIK
jgi:hypothetical protein